jgi:hypothetical protein
MLGSPYATQELYVLQAISFDLLPLGRCGVLSAFDELAGFDVDAAVPVGVDDMKVAADMVFGTPDVGPDPMVRADGMRKLARHASPRTSRYRAISAHTQVRGRNNFSPIESIDDEV